MKVRNKDRESKETNGEIGSDRDRDRGSKETNGEIGRERLRQRQRQHRE